MELKSLDRINNRIDEGKIKRIYCMDARGRFVNKLYELFGNRVPIDTIGIDINKTELKEGDCILFYEYPNSKIMEFLENREIYEDKIFVKILTEDIFLVNTLKNERNIIVDDGGITLSEGSFKIIDESNINRSEVLEIKDEWFKSFEDDFKVVTKNDYALTRLKDGCNVECIETEWYKISKGHNFVFKIADIYISVDYLDRILK